MKYKVFFVTQLGETSIVVWKVMFPRSLLAVQVVFDGSETENGVRLSRKISLGRRNPFLGGLVEKAARLLLGEEYLRKMVEHNQDGL
jgi:hypothetical protein